MHDEAIEGPFQQKGSEDGIVCNMEEAEESQRIDEVGKAHIGLPTDYHFRSRRAKASETLKVLRQGALQ